MLFWIHNDRKSKVCGVAGVGLADGVGLVDGVGLADGVGLVDGIRSSGCSRG